MIECKICNKKINPKVISTQINLLSRHITKYHKSAILENYYIQYMNNGKKSNKCETCNEIVSFENIGLGYKRFCDQKCYGNNKNIRAKCRKTNISKYGGTGFESEELRKKSQDSIYEKYGVISPIHNREIKDKIEKTMLDKYGVKHNFNGKFGTRKCDATCIEKYGNDYFDHIADRLKLRMLEKYGVDNIRKTKEFQIISKKTKFKNYGDENYNNREKAEKTCLERYGVANIALLISSNAGWKYFKIKEYKLPNNKIIKYQSKCELNFIEQCIKDNIIIENGETIKYKLNDKMRNYIIDFKIFYNNKWQLIEIKGAGPWYYKSIEDGSLKAKNAAATEYSIKNNYHPFKLILHK